MAEQGIWVKVLPALDMIALSAVVNQMKKIFGQAGDDISKSLGGAKNAIGDLQDAMIAAQNKAAQASLQASRAAANATIIQRDAQKGLARDEEDRSDKQIRAIATQQAASDAAAAAAVKAQNESKKAATAAAEHDDAANRSLSTATKLGTAWNAVGFGAAAGTAALVGATATIAGNWEQMMTRIQVAGMVPAGQIKDLSDKLLNLSATMGVNQKDVAQASLMLSKAGEQYKDTSTQVTILKSAIELAKTEGADLTTVVQQMTTSMTDFNIPTANAANIAAQLQMAASNAKRPLEEFVESLHNVEPTAAAVLDKDTGLPQLLTVMSQMASQGAGMDQVTQNLNFMFTHLNDANSPQRSILGSLGIDTTQMAEDLKKPNGLINVLGELREALQKVTTGSGENAIVHLPTAYNNPQVTADMARLYQGLNRNPQQKAAADMLLAGNAAGTDMTPADYKQVRAAKASGGDFAAWYQDFLKTTGPADLIKQGIDPNMPIGMVYDKISGGQASFRSFQGLMGDPSNPNDTRWQNTLNQGQRVAGAHPDQNGDIQGWAAVMDTWKQKLDIFKDSLSKLGEQLGEKFLPQLKKWIDDLTGFVSFMNGHQGLLDAAVNTLETLTEIWVGSKLIGGITNLATSLGNLGGKVGPLGTEAATAEGKVGKLTSAFAGMGGPIGVILAAIAAATPYLEDFADKHLPHPAGAPHGFAGFDLLHLTPPKPPAPYHAPAGVGQFTPYAKGPNGEWLNPSAPSALAPAAPGADPSDATAPPGTPGATTPGGTPGPDGSSDNPVHVTIPGLDQLVSSATGGGPGGGNEDTGSSFDTGTDSSSGGKQLGGLAGIVQKITTDLFGGLFDSLFQQATGGADDQGVIGQIDSMTDAQRLTQENDLKINKSIRNYHKAVREYVKALKKYGPNDERTEDALDNVYNAKDSIQSTADSMQDRADNIQQQLNDPNLDPAKKTKLQTQLQGYTNGVGPSAQSGVGAPPGAGAVPSGATVPLTQNPDGSWTSPNAAWSHLINRESGGQTGIVNRTDSNAAAGDPSVGLFQITGGTWRGAGGAEFAPGAGQATPQQQAAVAARILQKNPSGSDWGAGMAGRENAQQLLQGLQAPAPAPTSAPIQGPGLGDLKNVLFGTGQGMPFNHGMKLDPSSFGGPPAPRPGYPGYQPGIGYVDSGGKSTGYNPAPVPGSLFGPQGILGAGGVAAGGPGLFGQPGGTSLGGPPGAQAARRGQSSAPQGGVGQPAGAPTQAQQPKQQGGGGGGGGLTGSGLIGAAMAEGASGGMDMGAGAAMVGIQTAMQEGERFAKYLGQVAGIGIQGVQQTLHLSDPDGGKGGKGVGSGGWLGKIGGALAGSHPQSDMTAGKSAPPMKPQENKDAKPPGGGAPPPPVTINNHYNGQQNPGQVTRDQNSAMAGLGMVGPMP